MSKWKKIGLGVAALAVIGLAGYHGFMYSLGIYASAPVYQTSRGALDGYDPVAYFTDSKPVPGSDEFTHEWNGATWHFASAQNRDAFRSDPEKYAPQFGGYCAYAVASGYTAKTSPQAWHIEDGKLYFNFDDGVMAEWRSKRQELIAAGERNWPAVIQD